jgi:hypothetical protein
MKRRQGEAEYQRRPRPHGRTICSTARRLCRTFTRPFGLTPLASTWRSGHRSAVQSGRQNIIALQDRCYGRARPLRTPGARTRPGRRRPRQSPGAPGTTRAWRGPRSGSAAPASLSSDNRARRCAPPSPAVRRLIFAGVRFGQARRLKADRSTGSRPGCGSGLWQRKLRFCS